MEVREREREGSSPVNRIGVAVGGGEGVEEGEEGGEEKERAKGSHRISREK